MARNTLKDSSSLGLSNELQERYSDVDIFSTQGRIGRRSYFVYSIVLPFICFSVIASIAGIIGNFRDHSLGSISNIANIASYALLAFATVTLFLIIVRLTIQRCHDFNASGWLAILSLIPFANIIFSLVSGNNGLNSYGEAPKPPSTFVKIGVIILTLLLIAFVVFSAIKWINIDYLVSYLQSLMQAV